MFEYSASAALNSALNHPILSEKEEKGLLYSVSTKGDKDALEKLIMSNQRLVASVVRRYNPGIVTNDVEREDLMQAGNIGLLKAVEMWDPKKDVKFSTYAYYWIRSTVRRTALIRISPLSVSHQFSERIVKIRRAKTDYLSQGNADPTKTEIAARAGIPVDDVTYSAVADQTALSLESLVSDGDGRCGEQSYNVVDETQRTEEYAERNVLLAQVNKEIESLNDKASRILKGFYGLDGEGGKTYSELAREHKCSRQYVKYVIDSSLLRIRKNLTRH